MRALEESLGFAIHKPELYERAFTHRSMRRGKASYERFEFLGDAVLNFVVAKYLFDAFPEADEGFLTQARNNMVSSKRLAYLARRLSLHRFVHVDDAHRCTTRIMEDVFEALVAGVYLDLGLATARNFVLDVFRRYVTWDHLMVNTNYKSILAQWVNSQTAGAGGPPPQYEILNAPDVDRAFHVRVKFGSAHGEGWNVAKKDAEQEAAHALLVALWGGPVHVSLDPRGKAS